MRLNSLLKPAWLLVMMVAFTPLLMPATAGAQATTIEARVGGCSLAPDHYQVQLQAGDQSAPDRIFPTSVTLHFADGSTAEAQGTFSASFGTKVYRLAEPQGVPLTGATTQWDTATYPGYRFTVTTHPCVEPAPAPTYSVTGDIVQRGNQKPVANLTVCLVELNSCTTTDANGSFTLTGVEDGTYTLYTDGNNWKAQYNTVTVSGGDVHVSIIQFKGGGNGK